MKLKISFLLISALFIIQSVYPLFAIKSQVHHEIKNDSILYIKDSDLTIITTQSNNDKRNQQKEEQESTPAPPIKIKTDSAVQIKMQIIDSSSNVVREYNFTAAKAGDYQINVWAFYENLSPGSYECLIQFPGKLIKQKFFKIK